MRRLSGRRICVKNGHVYHVDFDPPKNEGVCDQDGSRLIQRDDDKPETVQQRLDVYHEQTKPLIDWYEERGLLRRFDGTPLAGRGARPHPRHAGHTSSSRTRSTAMIIRKTPEEIEQDRRGGRILARCHEILRSKARPGVTTAELDEAAERFIRSQGAEPAFKGYRGFPGSICASPNSMVVHGIPGTYELERGDILSIDIGVVLDGWVADAAITLPIGNVTPIAHAAAGDHARGAVRGRRAVPARQPARATSRTRSRRASRRRLLGRSARWWATGSAATCTRTRRSPTSASPAPARSSRRAWCLAIEPMVNAGEPRRADGLRQLGRLLARTARWRPISSTPSRSPPTGPGSSPPGTLRGRLARRRRLGRAQRPAAAGLGRVRLTANLFRRRAAVSWACALVLVEYVPVTEL